MSKERAQRRAARQAEIEASAAARARAQSAQVRRRARQERFARLVPRSLWSSRPRSTGPLAVKRRRVSGMLILGFVATQVLTWAYTPDWPTRAGVLVASIFIFPLIAVFVL